MRNQFEAFSKYEISCASQKTNAETLPTINMWIVRYGIMNFFNDLFDDRLFWAFERLVDVCVLTIPSQVAKPFFDHCNRWRRFFVVLRYLSCQVSACPVLFFVKNILQKCGRLTVSNGC